MFVIVLKKLFFKSIFFQQVFANKYMYIALYTLIGLTTRMFFSYTSSTITTIEKRFKFSSKISGKYRKME